MINFKKMLVFIAGVILAAALLIVTFLAGLSLLSKPPFFYLLLFGMSVLMYVIVFFAWKKLRMLAIGMIFCTALAVVWIQQVYQKATYEHLTWQATRFPNRIVLYSKPDKAQFISLDTNSDLIAVGGLHVYYKKQGKIVAMHKDFPGVRLFADIKANSSGFIFDFNNKEVIELQPPFLARFIK